MFKHFFTFLLIFSSIIPSVSACDLEAEKQEQNFFPQKFTESQLASLINDTNHGFKDGYKIFSISQEDRDTLYNYSPSAAQVISGPSFPDRVVKTAEYVFIQDDVHEYRAKYTVNPAYSLLFSQAQISVKGEYDVLRTFLPGENLDNNTLCLHRLRDLFQDFVSQTENRYRLNLTLAKLFYTLKVLEKDEPQQALYHAVNKADYIDLGYMALNEYMKAEQISSEIRIKVLDREPESLKPQFYDKAFIFLKSKIYDKLGINEDILETMYKGKGLLNYTEKYNEAVRQDGLKKSTH